MLIDVESVIRKDVEFIVKNYNPIAIWLFGSMSKRKTDKYSDVDLLIILPDGTDPYITLKIEDEINQNSILIKEVLVNTPKTFLSNLSIKNSIQETIYEEGLILYG